MSTESDSNSNHSCSGVGEEYVTEELTSRKRVYSQANLNEGMIRNDTDESSCSDMNVDSKKILDKFNYCADVEEIKAIWLKTLERAETTGTALLLAFIVGSTGCPYVFLEESDYLKITSIRKFEEAMKNARTSKHKFQLNRILEFINCTFSKEVLLRKFIMKEFVSFILLMSGSRHKKFRMVAVHVGTAVMSLLLKLEVELKSVISGLETSLNSNISLTDSEIDNVRINKQETEKLNYITNHFSVLFEKFCHQCHRDVETDIRLCVITTLAAWLMDYPQKFLSDNYLRYFVWMLCDSSAKVRFRAMKVCICLFKNKCEENKLQMFVLKSKPFIVKMISDVSPVVAEAAITCLHFIYMNYSSVLTNEECEQIYCKVYSVKSKIAEAAGSFVLQKITKGAQNEMAMLQDLARFHFETGVTGHEDYFISAFINNTPFLMHWKLWTKTILFTTNVDIQVVLCRMLISVIRLISNSEQYIIKKMKTFPFFQQEKYITLKKRFHADQFHKMTLQKMTLHFAHMLPQLIQLFQLRNKCLIPLIQIPQHFDYNYTVDLSHVVELLNEIYITSKSSLKDIYCCCSITTILENSQDSKVVTKCKKFVKLFCERYFRDAVMTILKNKLDLKDEDLVQHTQLIIRKTLILVTFHSLHSTPVLSLAFQGLQVVCDFNNLSDDLILILKLLSSICFGSIFTQVDEMFLTVENTVSVCEESMKSLRTFTCAYLETLIVLLKKITCSELVETAFIAVCYVFLTFSKYNVKLLKLKSLVIIPSEGCMELVSGALQILVPFSDHNQNSKKLYRQQRCLKKYCILLESETFKTEYLCNVLPYLKNEGLKEIAGKTLCTLFRKDALETSRVIICSLSFLFSISEVQGADVVGFAKIIANTLSAGIKKKSDVVFRLHEAAFKYIQTHKHFEILKVIVGFADLLNKNMLLHVRRLVELFFGYTVPIDIYNYLGSVHQIVGITDYESNSS